jgi:hypothetical protein
MMTNFNILLIFMIHAKGARRERAIVLKECGLNWCHANNMAND